MTTFQDSIRATLARGADSVALTFEGNSHTWRDLAAYWDRLSAAFDGAAIPPRTPVVVVARNHPSMVAGLLGLALREHRVILIDPLQKAERLASSIAVEKSAAVIVCEQERSEAVAASVSAIGAALIVLGDLDQPVELAASGSGVSREALAEAELGIEISTSGTTGAPKRIAYSYRTCEATGRDACAATALMLPAGRRPDGEWPIIQIFPIAHIGGLYYILQMAVGGQHQLMLEKFEVAKWVAAVERYRPPLLWLHPPGIRMVLDAGVPAESLSGALGLRTGSAPLETEVRERFSSRYGIPIIGYFGATEYCGIVSDWTYDDILSFHASRPLSVGRPRPGIELRVVDPSDGEAVLLPGSSGLLHIRVPRVGGDWFRTNDLATLDAEGFLFLDGRADSVINRGGFKVSAVHVAEALRRHPDVADVAVIALADKRLGQIPAAAIERRPGTRLGEEEIAAFARRQLLSYQVPVHYVIADRLPRASLAKIDQAQVRRMIETRVAEGQVPQASFS